MEIAVGAFFSAKRDMYVDTCHCSKVRNCMLESGKKKSTILLFSDKNFNTLHTIK